MKKSTIIVIVVIVLIAIWGITSYNGMVKMDESVSTAWSNVENQYQRRSDLIPNLVNTVKGYASQEKDIFTDIANARSKLSGANNITEEADADSELSNALSRLLLIVERYPDLKLNENFKDLSVQLEGTENRIAIARQDYNDAVTSYNKKVKKFPSSIVASLFGFDERPLYKASEGAKDVPSVDFSK